MNMYDSSEYYSDGESVVDSLSGGHVSPARSMESWSPMYQEPAWSDLEKDFSGNLIDVLTNGAAMINNNNHCNKIDFSPQAFNNSQNTSNFLGGNTLSQGNLFKQNSNPSSSLNCPMYENMQNCTLDYQQQMYNNAFTAELDNYLLPENNNTLPNNQAINMDDLKNLNVEELFQNPINSLIQQQLLTQQLQQLQIQQQQIAQQQQMLQQQQQQRQQIQPQPQQQQMQQQMENNTVKTSGVVDSTIFNINRSTMDNNSHQRFLELIKQQQKVNSADSISNQSSPPPTPGSDWSDIPSPTSSINDFDLNFSQLSPGNKKSTQQHQNTSSQVLGKPKKKPRKPYSTKSGKPRLYRFLKDILNDPKQYPCIEWVNKSTGTFKFLDSSEVARLWGFRKNKPAMKYENFARSLRTYIAKGILTKPRNKLVYCFAQTDDNE